MSGRTRYAKSGDLHIAYQVVGEGDSTVVDVPGWISARRARLGGAADAAFLRRLSAFTRLVMLDRRGLGMSDPVPRVPTLEERMDDVRAVMDDAQIPRATLLGVSEGGAMCVLFAATYPERTSSLILLNTFARYMRDEAAPWGRSPETSACASSRPSSRSGAPARRPTSWRRAWPPAIRHSGSDSRGWSGWPRALAARACCSRSPSRSTSATSCRACASRHSSCTARATASSPSRARATWPRASRLRAWCRCPATTTSPSSGTPSRCWRRSSAS